MLQTKSQPRTARLLRLSVDQVRHVMERSVSFGLSLRRSTQVYHHLSIDEKAFHKGHDYVSILTDNDTGIVIDVVGGRRKDEVNKLIDNALTPMQQQWVETISMDMWESYMLEAREHFPKAHICHDMFHLVTYLNNAVNDVRKRERSVRQQNCAGRSFSSLWTLIISQTVRDFVLRVSRTPTMKCPRHGA